MNNLIHIPRQNTDIQYRLMCFPYAGGSATPFYAWKSVMPTNIELAVIQLPGRGAHFNSPAYNTMDKLLEDLLKSYMRLSKIPTIFYGHSMGAQIAYALMVKLYEIDEQLPSLFFAAASPAPATQLCKNPRHLFSDEALIAELSRIPGSNTNLLQNTEIREVTMPALRSDFELLDTYVNHFSDRLSTSLCAIAGTQDLLTENQLLAWNSLFVEAFSPEWVDGDHFFVDKLPATTLDKILRVIEIFQ